MSVTATELQIMAGYFQRTYRDETIYSIEPQDGYFIYPLNNTQTAKVSAGATTFTLPQPVITITGMASSSVTVTLPDLPQIYYIVNKMSYTGSYTLKFVSAGSGKSVSFTVPAVDSSAPSEYAGYTLMVDDSGNVFCIGSSNSRRA